MKEVANNNKKKKRKEYVFEKIQCKRSRDWNKKKKGNKKGRDDTKALRKKK